MRSLAHRALRPLAAVATALLVALLAPCVAVADPVCTAGPADDSFPICFDPGNRLVLHAGYGGVGGAIALRHVVTTDDPGISWRMEHGLVEGSYDALGEGGQGQARGALYRGRFLRHSRDGHIMLPTSPPKKLFLPFDIGTEVTLGSFVATHGEPLVRVGVVRAALLFEVTRSGAFGRRLVFGTAARWDIVADTAEDDASVAEHQVAPFSLGVLGLHLESKDGLTVLDLELEAGPRWSSTSDWNGTLIASAGVERVVVAVNDLPLSLYCQGGWEDPGRGAWLAAGVRLALFGSTRTPRGR